LTGIAVEGPFDQLIQSLALVCCQVDTIGIPHILDLGAALEPEFKVGQVGPRCFNCLRKNTVDERLIDWLEHDKQMITGLKSRRSSRRYDGRPSRDHRHDYAFGQRHLREQTAGGSRIVTKRVFDDFRVDIVE